jgi:hypothetical protein
VADCGLFTPFEMLTLSLIGQVPGPVHQLRDSVLTWPLRGREVVDCGFFTHFEILILCDWSGSGTCPPIAGQFTRVASRRTRDGGLWTVHSF